PGAVTGTVVDRQIALGASLVPQREPRPRRDPVLPRRRFELLPEQIHRSLTAVGRVLLTTCPPLIQCMVREVDHLPALLMSEGSHHSSSNRVPRTPLMSTHSCS